MLRIILIVIVLVGIPFFDSVGGWEDLGEGIAYETVVEPKSGATIHLARIDLTRNKIKLVPALGKARATLHELVDSSGAKAAINASFFDLEGRPMGLVVQDGMEKNMLRRAEWGIFQMLNDIPSIIHTRDYSPTDSRRLAVQTGPRLVVSKKVPSFKNDVPARRSAVCTVEDGKGIIFVVVYPNPLTLKSFAEAIRPYCSDALNLDGGASTQFYLKTEKKLLYLPGREPIPNALAVFPQ